MMYLSRFVFCFVVAVNLALSGLGASLADNNDTEGRLQASNGTESDQKTLYIVALSSSEGNGNGQVHTDSQDGGLRISITSRDAKNTITISDSPVQGASYVLSDGILHIYLLGSSNQNEISYNGKPIYLAARLLDITTFGWGNRHNININGTPTQESDTGSSTNGLLRISLSGSSDVNNITVNGNPIQPGDELFNIQIIGPNNTNEITINGANSQPQNSRTRAGTNLNIGIMGSNTVNTININDRATQSDVGILNIRLPESSQSDVRVNGSPWHSPWQY